MRDFAFWTDTLWQTLERYDAALVRAVAGRLVKPRGQWPTDELITRCVAAVTNAAVIDRRVQDLDPACRKLLACIGRSRQPCWRLGSLIELVTALGHAEGTKPIFDLFEAGLLYPELPAADGMPKLQSFEGWLGQNGGAGYPVFAHPAITARALKEDLGLPVLAADDPPATAAWREADGLEWPLRLAALWQQVAASPLRRTQQGDFFKRDFDRLRTDPLLTSPPADNVMDLPDPGLLTAALAEAEAVLVGGDGELRAGALPAAWELGLTAALASLWAALSRLRGWNPLDGAKADATFANPFPSAQLLLLLLLLSLREGQWARPHDLETWLVENHPYWAGDGVRPSRRKPWAATFLLGLAYPLRMVQATRGADGEWLVRLSPTGRWLLGEAGEPPEQPQPPQTLLVQPNLEILVYRQGLTPHLISRLGRLAAWKTLGSACTLQLQPETVYRALESGLTFDDVLRTLERHGMRPTPPAVVDLLRTWADKRERITVYPAAALFEFANAEDLNAALARGLAAVRLSDKLAVVTNEADIDFRHFRLTGTRDYGRLPEPCVAVNDDGVTLAVDLSKSDLLLEAELQRFAEPLDGADVNGQRRYRLTPRSLASGRETGLTAKVLDEWFTQRAGRPPSAAARLLFNGSLTPAVQLRSRLVLHVPTAEIADGLQQWPGTRPFVEDRLGPTALVVSAEHAEDFSRRLAELGVQLTTQAPS